MGKRGPRPMPRALRMLNGNAARKPLNENEPTPPDTLARKPEWLKGESAAVWSRVAPQLRQMGLLTAIDRDALILYCETWSRWKAARDHIDEHGMVFASPSGYPLQSPYVSIANKCQSEMRRLMAEFGMSPSARTQIDVGKLRPFGSSPEAEDEFLSWETEDAG